MFLPHTDSERSEMLRTIGVSSIDELFQDVPEKVRYPTLNLPPALTEMEVAAQLQQMALANETTQDLACFLGAGAIITTFLPQWITFCAAMNFILPIPHISPRFPRERYKRFLNTKA